MLFEMLKFEWRYFTRQPSFFVISLLLFFVPFLSVAVEDIQLVNNNGNNYINSPYNIALATLIMGFFGMFLVVNFVANTAIRNQVMNMSELLYTRPIPPLQYQLGRFLGSYLVVLSVSCMVPVGLFIGSLMPWLDSQQLGPNLFSAYILPFVIYTIPTSFALSCFFYAAAIRFRSMMAVYLFAVFLFALYAISGTIFTKPSEQTMMAIMDPFGVRSFLDYTKYWSGQEKNYQLISLSGVILLNRITWVIAAIFVLLTLGKIFKSLEWRTQYSKKKTDNTSALRPLDNEINYRYQAQSTYQQFLSLVSFEIKQVMFSPSFIVLLIFAAVIVIASFIDPSGNYGSVNYPLTQYMVELIRNAFSLSLLIVITFYVAEVVWRERNNGIGDIIDSLPVQNFTIWASKLLAVFAVIALLLIIGMLATITNQLIKGHFQIELAQYLISLFYFIGLQWMLLAVVAFMIQAMSPNKYIGMLVFVCFMFIPLLLNSAGIEHNMFNYSNSPLLQYSDMNQYGWFLVTQNHYMLYWSSLALVLGIFSFAMWQRGPEVNLRARFAQLGYTMGKLGQALVVLGLVSFISIGTIIHFNTKVINQFITQDEYKQERADYEKLYSQFENSPIPTITEVKLDVAIFPELRKLEVIAQLSLENKTNQTINRFLVNYPNYSSTEIQGAEISDFNNRLKTAWVSFDEALAPGDTSSIKIFVTRMHRGFKDGEEDTSLVKNGTFINNLELLPHFGVDQTKYLDDAKDRRHFALNEYRRAYALEDSAQYETSFLGKNANKIDFEATLSTHQSQIAIAPGNLEKSWTEGGRNYFTYKMNIPMINFYTIMSAEYELKKYSHKDIDILVYFHHEHFWNVDRMIESSKDALDLYSNVFGPYQYEQLTIVEFPGYRTFAQSFANTVPYSEKIGFISDLRNPKKIDIVYYVTAHEVAHQWFGHQLNAANVQGARVLIESLSQYAALQLMQKKYGEVKIRKFLTYELDNYLRGRANEKTIEMPFMREEGQSYIYYNKASIILMAIADRIGTERLNTAIRELITSFNHAEKRLATSQDLLDAIKRHTKQKDHQFVEDQFSKILLSDIRLTSATVVQAQARLELQVQVNQREVDKKGQEININFIDEVDIVVFDGDPNDFNENTNILYRQKWPLKDGINTINIELSDISSPDSMGYVGVDPFVRFIDKNSKDNIIKL